MATDFFMKRGDRLPNFRVQLTDSLGNNPDLTTAESVTFIMTDKATGALIVDDGPVNIIAPPTNGIVEYEWEVGSTDIASTYNAEFEVHWPDSKDESFPNAKYIVIKIVADLENDGA